MSAVGASLADKVRAVERIMRRGVDTVFNCPVGDSGYRFKTSLRLVQRGARKSFAFNSPVDKKLVLVDDGVPILHERINRALPIVADHVSDRAFGRNTFEAKLQTTLSGELAVTLFYNKPLAQVPDWMPSATELKNVLTAETDAAFVTVSARSYKRLLTTDRTYLNEVFELVLPEESQRHRYSGKDEPVKGETDLHQFYYRQNTESFSQPNAYINKIMLQWALAAAGNTYGIEDNDLLELYCGNGNFTVPLAKTVFDKALASETSRASVADAKWAIWENHLSKVKVARLSAAEFTQAYFNERQFERLRDVDLDEYRFRTILVDPPREGLDEASTNLLAQHEGQIIYISCNPLSLARDLEQLALRSKHDLKIHQLVCFDQFPGTDHIECGVEIEMRPR